MSQLRRQQRHDMTPRTKGARLFLHPRRASYLGDGVGWNKIANLAQNVELRPRWFVDFVFHACRVAGFKSSSQRIFSNSCGTAVQSFRGFFVELTDNVHKETLHKTSDSLFHW
jgi:hypothetical protein